MQEADGAAARTTTWPTNVGNRKGEVLICGYGLGGTGITATNGR